MDTQITRVNGVSVAVESISETANNYQPVVIPSEVIKGIFPRKRQAVFLNILGSIVPLLSILQFGISIFIICEYKTRRTYYGKFLVASVLSFLGGMLANHASRNVARYLKYVFASELLSTAAAITSCYAIDKGLRAIIYAYQDCYPYGCKDYIKNSGPCETECVVSYTISYWIIVCLTGIIVILNILLSLINGFYILKNRNLCSLNRKVNSTSQNGIPHSRTINLYTNSQHNSASNLLNTKN